MMGLVVWRGELGEIERVIAKPEGEWKLWPGADNQMHVDLVGAAFVDPDRKEWFRWEDLTYTGTYLVLGQGFYPMYHVIRRYYNRKGS